MVFGMEYVGLSTAWELGFLGAMSSFGFWRFASKVVPLFPEFGKLAQILD